MDGYNAYTVSIPALVHLSMKKTQHFATSSPLSHLSYIPPSLLYPVLISKILYIYLDIMDR